MPDQPRGLFGSPQAQPTGVLGARPLTPNERLAGILGSAFQAVGIDNNERDAYQRAQKYTNLLNWTPFGIPQAGYDAGQALGAGANSGNVPQMALGAGLAAMASMPAAKRLEGIPIDLFHGTSSASEISALIPGARGPFGGAVYMTPNSGVAERYGGNMYSAKIDQGQIFNGMGSRFLPSDVNPYDIWREQTNALKSAVSNDSFSSAVDKLSPQDGYPLYWELRRATGSDEAAQEALRRAGFNGISGWVDGPEVAIFGKQSVQKVK